MLVREVRSRVLELAKGDPKLIKKIHSDFDLNQSGNLTIDEVTNMIAKLKISVERKYVHPFFKFVDQFRHRVTAPLSLRYRDTIPHATSTRDRGPYAQVSTSPARIPHGRFLRRSWPSRRRGSIS